MHDFDIKIRFTVNARHFIGIVPHMNTDLCETIVQATKHIGHIEILSYNIENCSIERKLPKDKGYKFYAFVDACCLYHNKISAMNLGAAVNKAIDDIYRTINKVFKGERTSYDYLLYSSASLECLMIAEQQTIYQRDILDSVRRRIESNEARLARNRY